MAPKTCFKCGSRKARTEFYRHPQMGDGLLGKCKECTKADARANYAKRRQYYREYNRRRFQENPDRLRKAKEYARTPAGRASHARALKRMVEKWPGKARARWTISNAVRDKRLARHPCTECGSPNAEAHHEDYRRPLVVTWLCPKHHRMRHGKVA